MRGATAPPCHFTGGVFGACPISWEDRQGLRISKHTLQSLGSPAAYTGFGPDWFRSRRSSSRRRANHGPAMPGRGNRPDGLHRRANLQSLHVRVWHHTAPHGDRILGARGNSIYFCARSLPSASQRLKIYTFLLSPDGAGRLPHLAVRHTYDSAGRLILVERGRTASSSSTTLTA